MMPKGIIKTYFY